MKKLLALALALLLLMSFNAVSMAEEAIDFSSYSLDELLEIKTALANEIASRPGGEKMVLYSGQYIIGEDIPAGDYTFKFLQNGDSDDSETEYYIYENESMYKYDVDRQWLGDMPRVDDYLEGDGEKKISLYPGEYLYLRYNGAEITRIGNVRERDTGYVVPEGTTIPRGNYTVGAEIPAGTYKIYFSGTTSSRVRVFQDANEAGNQFNHGTETILDWSNTEGTITLNEGNVIRVEYTPIIMTKGVAFTFD